MNKRVIRVYDPEIADCFELFGGEKTAIFFEALRYRQQLFEGQFFSFKSSHIKKMTSLGYRLQIAAREVLEATGFIETRRCADGVSNSIMQYKITPSAFKAIAHTPYPQGHKFYNMKREFTKKFNPKRDKS